MGAKDLVKSRKIKILGSALLVIGMFVLLFLGLGQLGVFFDKEIPLAAAEVSIIPTKADKLGAEVGTSFILKSQEALSEKLVAQTLKVSPEFAYTLAKKSGGTEYEIVPKEKLAIHTVYTMSFDVTGQGRENYSWAFQTKGDFVVLGTLPGNQATHVPVNTGIEIVFSHESYELDKVKDFIQIEPSVGGSFEKHKRTLVFAPKGLAAGTVYTVTVKKGLPLSAGSTVLSEDYKMSFETADEGESGQGFSFDLENAPLEFESGEIPVFPIWYHQREAAPAVAVSLYKYADDKSFIAALAKRDEIPAWSYFTYNRYSESLSGLAKVAEFNTEFQSIDSYSHYLSFPEALAPGYYLAEIKAGSAARQVRFQVTDLATYLARSDEKSILWVNDLKTKAPAPGVIVEIAGAAAPVAGDKTGVVVLSTNRDGLSKVGSSEGALNGYALVRSGAKEAVVPLAPGERLFYGPVSASFDYWKYLYLDRELFKPGDTLHYWGVAAPRAGGGAEGLRLELHGGNSYIRGNWYGYANNEEASILTKPLTLAGNTYHGEIELPVLVPGYYQLRLMAGEKTLLTRGFSVEQYRKPAYRLSVEPEKRAIFVGEKTGFLAKAAFFEGTPVPSLSLSYHLGGKNGTVVTDSKGEAKIAYQGQRNEQLQQHIDYIYLDLRAELPEYGEINADSMLALFKSKVHLTAKAKRSGESFEAEATLSGVDLSKINAGEYLSEENYVTGPVANSAIRGKIFQDIWTKIEEGERYDFISKKIEKIYRYDYSSKHLADLDLSMTTDANGKATYSGKLDPANSYYLELTAKDAEGNAITRRVPLRGNSDNGYYDYQYYHLSAENETDRYLAGDKVELDFRLNEQKLAPRDNGFLYFRSQKEIEQYTVAGEPDYSFVFEQGHIPNININAVYFDGRSYHPSMFYLAAFEYESKGLEVAVTPDKKEYRPGEKVRLDVQVKDKNNKPVQAQVNLNLVDEALYALQDQEVNLLSTLYMDYILPYIPTRQSHYKMSLFSGGAEQGGEGGGLRNDFRDTVLFATLETGKDGKASTEFVLPDNLTSWRVTYHALADGLFAASGKTHLPVSLPFFVTPTVNDVYLEGDKPVVIMRAYGEELSNGQGVSYELKLATPEDGLISSQGKGVAFGAFDWALPTLKSGQYSLTIGAGADSFKDQVLTEFSVVKSLLARTVTEHELLSEGQKLQNPRGNTQPIKLTFSDYERGQYLRGLYQLAWQNGGRFEQQAAARAAQKLLLEYFPAEKLYFQKIDEAALRTYQQSDGGIAILPYAESDLAVTVLAISDGNQDVFDRRALQAYLYQKFDNSTDNTELSLTLWGLAALKQPVLPQINERLELKGLSPQEKIYLALASLEIGNGAYAQQVYRETIKAYGEELGATIRMKAGRDQDEIIAATTQMALLAARLDQPEKNKLYQYILENQGTDTLNLLEQAQIVKYNLAYLQGDEVSFTYELNGGKVSKTLKNQETYQLTVLPDNLEKIKFSQLAGKVGVVAAATVPYSAEDVKAHEGLSVTRSYAVKDKKTTSFGRADLVKVTLNYGVADKAPSGDYELIDILPAGLRFVERPYQMGQKLDKNLRYPSLIEGQKITFNVGKGTGIISYYARVVAPGEYTAEAALLSNINSSNISIMSNSDRVTIK